MNREIFLSYRRADSMDVTGRIADHLSSRFGAPRLFKDVESIPPGEDYRTVITQAVAECVVLVAVIGSRWLTVTEGDGTRRIDNPLDSVHIEIASALARKIPVIPVLVDGATVPKAADLPVPLRELTYRNAIHVRPDPDFRNDMARLCNELSKHFKTPSKAIAYIGTIAAGLLAVGGIYSFMPRPNPPEPTKTSTPSLVLPGAERTAIPITPQPTGSGAESSITVSPPPTGPPVQRGQFYPGLAEQVAHLRGDDLSSQSNTHPMFPDLGAVQDQAVVAGFAYLAARGLFEGDADGGAHPSMYMKRHDCILALARAMAAYLQSQGVQSDLSIFDDSKHKDDLQNVPEDSRDAAKLLLLSGIFAVQQNGSLELDGWLQESELQPLLQRFVEVLPALARKFRKS